jgi:hypothetical protein
VARTSQEQRALSEQLGWVLPYYDAHTTNPNYLEEEIKRLQVIRSYFLLDTQREEAFERISALAARIFEVSGKPNHASKRTKGTASQHTSKHTH